MLVVTVKMARLQEVGNSKGTKGAKASGMKLDALKIGHW
jgi:hypothetical protein